MIINMFELVYILMAMAYIYTTPDMMDISVMTDFDEFDDLQA